MHLNKLVFAFAAALAVPAAACGGDDGDSLTAGGFVTALGNSICGKAFECMASFPGTPADFTASFGADTNACVSGLNFISPAMLQASVDAGRVTFSSSAAGMCVSQIDALTCEAFWGTSDLPATCNTAIMGTVAVGGTCTINADCTSQACADGTCVAPG